MVLLKSVQWTSRQRGSMENVLRALLASLGPTGGGALGEEGSGDGEAAMIAALEKKYDAIRDKLFAQVSGIMKCHIIQSCYLSTLYM